MYYKPVFSLYYIYSTTLEFSCTKEPIANFPYLIMIIQAALADYLVLDGPQLWEKYQLFLMTFEKPTTL